MSLNTYKVVREIINEATGEKLSGAIVVLRRGTSDHLLSEIGSSGKYKNDSMPSGRYMLMVNNVPTNQSVSVGEGELAAAGFEDGAFVVGKTDGWRLEGAEGVKDILNLGELTEAGRVVVTDTNKQTVVSSITVSELESLEGVEGNLQEQLDGKADTSHTHGTGDIVSGRLNKDRQHEDTIYEGDARLSDARTPLSHSHGNLTNDGKVGTESDKVVTTTTGGAVTTSSRSGIDSRTSFPPATHTHGIGDVTNLQTALDGKSATSHSHTLAGDVSGAIGTTAIGNNKVTNAKLSTVATKTFKGRKTAGTGNLEDLTVADAVGMLKGTTANTLAEGNDSRLSDAREWTASTVTQAEAEGGTDTTRKAWTVERVWQAIAKATSGIVSSMWQTVSGKTQLITAQDIDMRNKKITNAGAGTNAGDLVEYEQAVLRLSGNVARNFTINTATVLGSGAPEWVAIKLPILKYPTSNRNLSLTFSISGSSISQLFRAHTRVNTSGNSRSLLVYKLTGDYADNSFKLVSDATHHYLLYYKTSNFITLHLHLVERFDALETGWNNPSFYTVTKGVSLLDYDEHITTAGIFPPHSHGNLTNDGKVGTESGLPVVTGAGGAVTTGKGTVENLITAGSIARGTITISGHSRENQFVRQCLGTMRIHHVSSALINNGETLFTLPTNWITGPQGVDRFYRLTNINCVGGTSNPPFIPVYVNPINGNVVYRGDVNFGQANTLTDATYSLAPIIEVI